MGEEQTAEGQVGEGQGSGTGESGRPNKAHGMGETIRDNRGGIRTGRDMRGGTSHQLPAEGGSWTSAGPSLDHKKREEGAEKKQKAHV